MSQCCDKGSSNSSSDDDSSSNSSNNINSSSSSDHSIDDSSNSSSNNNCSNNVAMAIRVAATKPCNIKRCLSESTNTTAAATHSAKSCCDKPAVTAQQQHAPFLFALGLFDFGHQHLVTSMCSEQARIVSRRILTSVAITSDLLHRVGCHPLSSPSSPSITVLSHPSSHLVRCPLLSSSSPHCSIFASSFSTLSSFFALIVLIGLNLVLLSFPPHTLLRIAPFIHHSPMFFIIFRVRPLAPSSSSVRPCPLHPFAPSIDHLTNAIHPSTSSCCCPFHPLGPFFIVCFFTPKPLRA